jgi:hypothetical protein
MKKSLLPLILLLAVSALPLRGQSYYAGDGGRGIRLAVLAPAGENLAREEASLPLYVQGMLTDKFKRFSAMTIIDRQFLSRVEAEQTLSLSGNFSGEDYIRLGNLTNARYILTGTMRKNGNRIEMQLAITEAETAERKASFTRSGPALSFWDEGIVNQAAAALLERMGVTLTDAGKAWLSAGDAGTAAAESALAKGIAAQNQGSTVEALSWFYRAAAADPASVEAENRLNALSGQVVSSGGFGSAVRNDIQQRRAWLGMMKECAAFYREHMPFDIVYDPVLRQEGNTDYVNGTADFAFSAALHPAESVFKVLNDLLRGLENTGRRAKWGFAGWPLLQVNPPDPAATVFGGARTFSFNIEAALLNEEGREIGRQNFSLTSGDLSFTAGAAQIPMPASDSRTVNFRRVSIKNLSGTGTITLKILKVNGIDVETFALTGYMRVLTRAEHAALPENRGRRGG